ncbi:Uncharacterized protein SCF082_LOCUS37406 [Durusdinium trenchii]|uniref:Uncharacterized protein n=1 Tax=Durusdinium trenchii TaxID=1381693 RepID=A0ABP0PQS0_9DINO
MPFVRLGPEVVEETPLAKAQALLARVLKDVNDCRTQAFRLQPIKLGTDLIAQLMAVATKLEGLAGRLQELVKKKNNKNKHYREIILEVDKHTKICRERIDLGKALVRASEKAGQPKASAKPKAAPKEPKDPKEKKG